MNQRVELKNVKHSAFASQETHCFEATVYIDGKRMGTVSNDGHGGCDNYSSEELREALERIAATLPHMDLADIGAPGRTMPESAETVIGDLVNKWLEARDMKCLCARKTLFRKPGESYQKGEYHTINAKFSPQVKAQIAAKYPGAEILNETI